MSFVKQVPTVLEKLRSSAFDNYIYLIAHAVIYNVQSCEAYIVHFYTSVKAYSKYIWRVSLIVEQLSIPH